MQTLNILEELAVLCNLSIKTIITEAKTIDFKITLPISKMHKIVLIFDNNIIFLLDSMLFVRQSQ